MIHLRFDREAEIPRVEARPTHLWWGWLVSGPLWARYLGHCSPFCSLASLRSALFPLLPERQTWKERCSETFTLSVSSELDALGPTQAVDELVQRVMRQLWAKRHTGPLPASMPWRTPLAQHCPARFVFFLGFRSSLPQY